MAEPTGSAIMVSDGEKLAKGDEYLCDDGTWKTLEQLWYGVTYTKWLMVPMRRPNNALCLSRARTGRSMNKSQKARLGKPLVPRSCYAERNLAVAKA